MERLHPTEPVLLVRGLLSEEETATLLGKAQERFNQSLVGGRPPSPLHHSPLASSRSVHV